MEHICYAPYTCSASLTIIEIIKFRAKIIQLLSFRLVFHAVGYVPKDTNRFNPPQINAHLNHTHILPTYLRDNKIRFPYKHQLDITEMLGNYCQNDRGGDCIKTQSFLM